MPAHHIDLTADVESEKSRRVAAVAVAVHDLLEWLTTTEALEQPLHRVGSEIHKRLMRLGVLLVGIWLVHRLPTSVPESLQRGRGWYRYRGMMSAPVRSRFGVTQIDRPEYLIVHGEGPVKLVPYDRHIGLAAGRMSLGVHLVVGSLIARMTFQEAHDVMEEFGVYAPSTRSMHGIVDRLGLIASGFMETLPAPEDDGEILVIETDHKGAPHMSPEEHRKRRRKQKKRCGNVSNRERKRIRRIVRQQGRERKKTGDKAKNARMASIGAVHTLRRLEDGSVEGPINRRVFGTFNGPRALSRRCSAKRRSGATGSRRRCSSRTESPDCGSSSRSSSRWQRRASTGTTSPSTSGPPSAPSTAATPKPRGRSARPGSESGKPSSEPMMSMPFSPRSRTFMA